MPTTTYMVIDPRHDHSLRIPRPDLSVTLGTPNACTNCHVKQDARWAAAKVAAWYPEKRTPGPHERLALTLAAADKGALDAQARLRELASDGTQSAIARATAFAELNVVRDTEALATLTRALHDGRALMRFGALQAVAQFPLEVRVRIAQPLLADSLKSIRLEAVRMLAGVPEQQLDPTLQGPFRTAIAEFIEAQRYNGDRVEARVNLGTFLAERGDAEGAVRELQAAIRMGPSSVPAYVNLADVYRAMGRDVDGEQVIRKGLEGTPSSSVLHYTLGLVLTRLNRSDTALHEFARAAELEPGNARFAYVHAIALNSAGKADAAITQLKVALVAHPANGDILSALAQFYAARGDLVQARRYAEQLRTVRQSGSPR
jgi:tetratricopeptide (TPR) repeat protein